MPTSKNQTIIGIPLNVERAGETRKFLIRLVEKLDVVFGYRGNSPYATISQLQNVSSTAGQNLTQLEQIILNTITENISTVNQALQQANEDASDAVSALKSSSTVANASNATQTITSPPTQAEVQNIQDQVKNVADQLNALLAALRGTEIIAT
jgi:hypothetical protein